MWKSAKSRSQEKFFSPQKKTDLALKEKDRAWLELEKKSARLKALRLAKEATDKEAAALAEAAKPAAPAKKAKRPAKRD